MSHLEKRVLQSLDQSVVAFNEGQPEFFEQFAKDAMIFTADSTDPIRGRDAYRKSYEAALTSQKREKTILDRNIQIVGDRAVVTQTAQIKQADSTANVRQTIVYGETDEGLKVLHLHTALLAPANGEAGLPGVRVVNEKIAAMAPVLGVAQ